MEDKKPNSYWESFEKQLSLDNENRMNNQFPMTIHGINVDLPNAIFDKSEDPKLKSLNKYVGSFCIIRNYKTCKVSIGIFLGFTKYGHKIQSKTENDETNIKITGEIDTSALYCLSSKKVIYNVECWWKPIKNLKDIQDNIEDYNKAWEDIIFNDGDKE